MAVSKEFRRKRIKMRIRKTISGTAGIPRLSVFRSNKQIYAQIIDDNAGQTLVSASSIEPDFETKKAPKADLAKQVGKKLAEKALAAGIITVKFDRGGYLYHGRVKSLAEGAREVGLKF